MACTSYSIRYSNSLATVLAGGGTSATWSVNISGPAPVVGEDFAGNATCSSGVPTGFGSPLYVVITSNPQRVYTVDATASASNGNIDAINDYPSPTPTVTPTRTPTPTRTVTPTPTRTVTVTSTPTPTPTISFTPTITPTPIISCNDGAVVWETIVQTGTTYFFTTGQTYSITKSTPGGHMIDGIELPQFYTCLDCTTTNNPPYYNVYENEFPGITYFTFSPAVENPIFAFYSLGSSIVEQTFSADTNFIDYYPCSAVTPTCGSASPTDPIYDFSLRTINGNEAFGAVMFPGTHSVIGIQALDTENRTNFLWGLSCDNELELEPVGVGSLNLMYSSCTTGNIYQFNYLSAYTPTYSGLTINDGPYEGCYARALPPLSGFTVVDLLPGLYDYNYTFDCASCAAETTPTPTPTVSISLTPSFTPSNSVTVTPSISLTPSFTPSNSVTVTPSISLTPTYTPTNSISVTPSISLTPSFTTTPTISITSGVSTTPTPTFSPSNSVSVTPSLSPTNSISVTPSISLTPSFTTTPTISVTSGVSTTPTPTFSPSNSISVTTSVSFTPTTTPSVTVSNSPGVTVTPTFTPSPSSSVVSTVFTITGCCDVNTYVIDAGIGLSAATVYDITGVSGLTDGCYYVVSLGGVSPINGVAGSYVHIPAGCSDPICSCPTPTPTVTTTVSSTPSVTPTLTVTLSITSTVTVTPSITPSISVPVTASITPSISITPTVTPSISITPSITVSISITPSPSDVCIPKDFTIDVFDASPTPTPTPTVTPSTTGSAAINIIDSCYWVINNAGFLCNYVKRLQDCTTGVFYYVSEPLIYLDTIITTGTTIGAEINEVLTCVTYVDDFPGSASHVVNDVVAIYSGGCSECQSVTVTPTTTQSVTPSITPSITNSVSVTPTITPTMTPSV